MYRRTELERIDDELATAARALQVAEQAYRDLRRTLHALVDLDVELTELARSESEVLAELARLTGVSAFRAKVGLPRKGGGPTSEIFKYGQWRYQRVEVRPRDLRGTA